MEIDHNVSAFILAGGKSIRFKEDKVLFPYRGKPLIEHVIDAVKPLVSDISIIANNAERFSYLGIACYPDLIEDAGPMGGLYTALSYCTTESAFLVACDMPDLSREFIMYMISLRKNHDIVVPCVKGWYEPLHAVYSVRCLPYVEKYIKEGKRQIVNFFESVRVRKLFEDEISLYADPAVIFKNINFQGDIKDQ